MRASVSSSASANELARLSEVSQLGVTSVHASHRGRGERAERGRLVAALPDRDAEAHPDRRQRQAEQRRGSAR